MAVGVSDILQNYFFIIPALMILLSLYFLSGRGAMLIAGYNTMSEKEREKYNVKELTRAMGIFMLVTAALTAATLYAGMTGSMMWTLTGGACIFLFAIAWSVYMNKNQKIKRLDET
ncbi:MAG: DUF3784 domain-containing protein [Methanimicrococcus sp.]|nr:DUF3784 domain-containing protein [Methanimicrococcus sp.]